MDTSLLEKKFEAMGARVKVFDEDTRFSSGSLWRRNRNPGPVTLNIRRDNLGEFFDLTVRDSVQLSILDLQKKDRHLLLMAKGEGPKSKFLCGHDERNWFTCAIPETSGVSTVFGAKQALKPEELQELEAREGLSRKRTHKRHRKLKSGRKIHRQGEFMFIPDPDFSVEDSFKTVILKKEPMSRGGNPHTAEFLHRMGGTTVYVTGAHPNGLTENEYSGLLKKNKDARKWNWQVMKRDPAVYAKGKISHTEHKTVNLGNLWHKVILNTEDKALAAKSVAFLD